MIDKDISTRGPSFITNTTVANPMPYGCRLSDAEAAVVQSAKIPRQVLSGKYDPIAGQRYAQWLADHLDCPLLTMGALTIYASSALSESDLFGIFKKTFPWCISTS